MVDGDRPARAAISRTPIRYPASNATCCRSTIVSRLPAIPAPSRPGHRRAPPSSRPAPAPSTSFVLAALRALHADTALAGRGQSQLSADARTLPSPGTGAAPRQGVATIFDIAMVISGGFSRRPKAGACLWRELSEPPPTVYLTGFLHGGACR